MMSDLAGQSCGMPADRTQRPVGWNAVADREHPVANVAGKAAVRIAALIENAEMPDQTVEIRAEARGRDDHLWSDGRTADERHSVGFDRFDRGDDLDAAGPHGADELVG